MKCNQTWLKKDVVEIRLFPMHEDEVDQQQKCLLRSISRDEKIKWTCKIYCKALRLD